MIWLTGLSYCKAHKTMKSHNPSVSSHAQLQLQHSLDMWAVAVEVAVQSTLSAEWGRAVPADVLKPATLAAGRVALPNCMAEFVAVFAVGSVAGAVPVAFVTTCAAHWLAPRGKAVVVVLLLLLLLLPSRHSTIYGWPRVTAAAGAAALGPSSRGRACCRPTSGCTCWCWCCCTCSRWLASCLLGGLGCGCRLGGCC